MKPVVLLADVEQLAGALIVGLPALIVALVCLGLSVVFWWRDTERKARRWLLVGGVLLLALAWFSPRLSAAVGWVGAKLGRG